MRYRLELVATSAAHGGPGSRDRGSSAPDHRRFWDSFRAVPLEALPRIEEKLALAACARSGLDTSSVALDMTNFATFIDTGNARAPIAQRGKAKQKRTDLRLVGLGLVVTRDGGVPLLSHAYPGSKPDVTQFPQVLEPAAGHAALAAAAGQDGTEIYGRLRRRADLRANSAPPAGTNLHYVGSVPASDCRDLLAVPGPPGPLLDEDRSAAKSLPTTACRELYGTGCRAIFTHPPSSTPIRPAALTAPRWPRPPGSSASWPPPWPAARPAVAAAQGRGGDHQDHP